MQQIMKLSYVRAAYMTKRSCVVYASIILFEILFEKLVVLGVTYNLQNPYLGLGNGRRYRGRSGIEGGAVLGKHFKLHKIRKMNNTVMFEINLKIYVHVYKILNSV